MQYRDVGNSGIGINDEGETQREEIDFGVIVDGFQLGSGKVDADENQIQSGGNEL